MENPWVTTSYYKTVKDYRLSDFQDFALVDECLGPNSTDVWFHISAGNIVGCTVEWPDGSMDDVESEVMHFWVRVAGGHDKVLAKALDYAISKNLRKYDEDEDGL